MVIMKPTPTPEEKGEAVDGGEVMLEVGAPAEEGGVVGEGGGGEEGGEMSLEPVRAPDLFLLNTKSETRHSEPLNPKP